MVNQERVYFGTDNYNEDYNQPDSDEGFSITKWFWVPLTDKDNAECFQEIKVGDETFGIFRLHSHDIFIKNTTVKHGYGANSYHLVGIDISLSNEEIVKQFREYMDSGKKIEVYF